MSRIINLPSGATATLRDSADITQGDRRKVLSVMKSDDNSAAATLEVSYEIIAIMVEEWSLELPPPAVRIESLDKLSIPDYDKLQDEAADFMKVLFPQLGKSLEAESDPKADTGNFNG